MLRLLWRRPSYWLVPFRPRGRGQPEKRQPETTIHQRAGLWTRGHPVHRRRAAAILALDTRDHTAATSTDRPKVASIDEKIASLLGIEASQLAFNAMAVNPLSGNTYLGVTRGKGADSTPVLLRVDRAGKLSEVSLKDVPFAAHGAAQSR